MLDEGGELAHAREAGRERDVGEPQVGGLDEHPRGLGPLRSRECERSGTEWTACCNKPVLSHMDRK